MALYPTVSVIYIRKFFQYDHQSFLLSMQPAKSIAVGMIIETNSLNPVFIYSINNHWSFQCEPGISLGSGVEGSRRKSQSWV